MAPTEEPVLNMWNYMAAEPSPVPEITTYPLYDLVMDVRDSVNSYVVELPTPVPIIFVETPTESCCTCILFIIAFMIAFALCMRRMTQQRETIVVHADGVPVQEASSIKIAQSNDVTHETDETAIGKK